MGYPSFNVGDVLTAADMNAVGLWKVADGTFTNAANFEITGFSSTYTSYRAVIRVSRHSGSGANELQAQLYNGATAKTDYYGSGWFAGFLGTSGNVGNRNNAANFPLTSAGSSSVANFVVLDITGMTSDEFTCTGSGFDQGNVRHETFGYARFTADTNDRIRVTPATANVTGSWKLYGYRN